MAVRQGIIQPVNFKMGSKQVERLCQGEEVVWAPIKLRLREWLTSDGQAWINSGINRGLVQKAEWRIIPRVSQGSFTAYWGTAQGSSFNEIDMRTQEYKLRVCCNGRSNVVDIADLTEENLNQVYNIKWNLTNLIINGETLNIPITPVRLASDIGIFKKVNFSPLTAVPCSFGNFLIETTTQTLNLTPCDIVYHPSLTQQSGMVDIDQRLIFINEGSGAFVCEGADLGTIYL